ncbi:hypothetical protein RRF57_002914 [Xylaria bambusicola]|uniref:Ubiquitin-like protease family profile domain-containing protein n=1 Tax=Xylaria bambusicola TaxID=326684 RepID=A0AAN7UTJ0_9PEZI
MPSSQHRLSTETSNGAAASVFTFSGLLAKAGKPLLARLESVNPFRTAADMTKPGNLGAPQPINTLSNNSASSRTHLGVLPAPRPHPSSSPPAKRQKFDERTTHGEYSSAAFVLDEAKPRKRSIEIESLTDSLRSVASNKSNKSSVPQNVPEYRVVDKLTKPKRFRKSRGDSKCPAREDIDSPPSGSIPREELTGEDEVDLIGPAKKPVVPHQLKHKQLGEHPIEKLASRFQRGTNATHSNASQIFRKVIDNADKRIKRGAHDSGPDELAPSEEELAASRATKRLKTDSSSLSTRGNIRPTKFKSTFTARTSNSMDAKHRVVDEQKEKAQTIIRDGLRIVRGVSGQYQYQAKENDVPDYCALSIREIGHILFPVDDKKDFLKQHRYLTLDIMKTKLILRSKEDEGCCIVATIFDSVNVANGSGPKLMVEFASEPEFHKFLQWVGVYSGSSSPIVIKDCSRAKLEKDFDEMMQRAKSPKIFSDHEIETSAAEDIRLLHHNHRNRSLRDHDVAVETACQPRLRDTMKNSPILTSNGGEIVSNRVLDDQAASVYPRRRTVSSLPVKNEPPESPELEPIPEGWTSLNVGWEKQWRNSLVYPRMGKNRATVDKDDIQRLDDGQFLNDNLIIFYLRYLQDELEKNNPDLAERIYFQNTFFYDKLKPTKNGQGINYDSVKTWTSKVDLFSKDYIIVPINEYAHWYVAIICNAPRLLPSSNSHERDNDNKKEVISIIDGNETSQGNLGTPSDSRLSNDTIDGEQASQLAREDVVEKLRRMSIDNSDHPAKVTKKTADSNAGEEVDSVPLNFDNDVYEIKDPDRPEGEVEHIATTDNPQRHKKPGKKPAGGPRKNDPKQPRIITLDSLGSSHSPTCSYLKQYLAAEGRERKEIEIAPSNIMGTTAKGLPEQTNHCDCGLFLLGYIQRFLYDPDDFIKHLLQRDGTITWNFCPSSLRNSIRELIFDLQKKQQTIEDEIHERKRRAKISSKQIKTGEALGYTATPATKFSDTSSTIEPANQYHRSDEADKSKSPPSLPRPLSPGSRRASADTEGAVFLAELADSEKSVKQLTANAQQSVPGVRRDDIRTTRQESAQHGWNVEEEQAPSEAGPNMIASPCETELTFDHRISYRAAGASPNSTVQSQMAKRNSTSPVTESSSNLQANFLPPLTSDTPSPKGSPGATPLDPVVVDDLNGKRDMSLQNPRERQKGQMGHQIVVEIPSLSMYGRSPRQDNSKTHNQKQTEQQSPYFLGRGAGERVVSAKPRGKPQSDIIDLSGD